MTSSSSDPAHNRGSGEKPTGFALHARPLAPDTARALNAVRSIVRAFHHNTRAVELALGISAPQLYVLQLVNAEPGISVSEIAERVGTHQSSASVVVRRLTDRGFLERTTPLRDRRRQELRITDAGLDLLRRAPQTVIGDLIGGSEALSDAKRAELAGLLEEWLDHAGMDNSSAPMMGEEEDGG